MVVRDQERQGVEDAAEERPAARDRSAHPRAAAAGQLSRVGERLREAHGDRGAERRREARDERVAGVVRGEHHCEDRRERRERAVDEADHGRLDALKEKGVLVAHKVEYTDLCAS